MQVTPAERKNTKDMRYFNEKWSVLNILEAHYTKQTFQSVYVYLFVHGGDLLVV